MYTKVPRLPISGMFMDPAAVDWLGRGVLSPFSEVLPLYLQDLYEAGELKWGTDEAQFVYILGNRSKQHLRLGKFQRRKTYSWSLGVVPTIPFFFPFLLIEHGSYFVYNSRTSPGLIRWWFVLCLSRVLNRMLSLSF